MFSWMLPPGSWQVVCGAVLFGGIVTFFDWASPPSPPSLPTAGETAEPGGVTKAAAGTEPWRLLRGKGEGRGLLAGPELLRLQVCFFSSSSPGACPVSQ